MSDDARACSRDVSRRAVLACGVSAAASLMACSDLLSRSESARRWIVDPALDDYRRVLDALAETVLPLEVERFPLRDPRRVTERMLNMFPLERERRFLGLQKTLMLFDTSRLFPIADGVIEAIEHRQLAAFGPASRRAVEDELARKRRLELDAWQRFAAEHGAAQRFSDTTLAARRNYLELWGGSEYAVRREFRNAARALFFMTAYSMDEVWPVIGYGGPLLEGHAPEPG